MSDAWAGPCRSCSRDFGEEEKPDAHGWCGKCRALLVRRSTWLAVPPAVLFFLLMFWLITWSGLLGSRFMVVWLALDAALSYVVFKIARRVAFDLLRTRAAPRKGI